VPLVRYRAEHFFCFNPKSHIRFATAVLMDPCHGPDHGFLEKDRLELVSHNGSLQSSIQKLVAWKHSWSK
jgi:hypothetical protein